MLEARNGYNSAAIKAAESVDAIKQGAKEIDMVINIGKAKENDFIAVSQDIQLVREATDAYDAIA